MAEIASSSGGSSSSMPMPPGHDHGDMGGMSMPMSFQWSMHTVLVSANWSGTRGEGGMHEAAREAAHVRRV